MSYFTTRVELHDADFPADYDKLHTAMKAEGFSQTVTDSATGKKYHLPTAEYSKIGDYTKNEVIISAQRAAITTGKKHAIVVTKGEEGRLWKGLSEVKLALKKPA